LNSTGFTLPPKLYDFLKWVALTVFPAAAALVLTIGSLLHWDPAVLTAGIITAADTFLGVLLGKSSGNYTQEFGDLIVKQDVDGTPMGFKIVGKQDNPIFQDGTKAFLNVKREQLVERPKNLPGSNFP
jgi:hypothetical protein